MKLKLQATLTLLLCLVYSGFAQVTSSKEADARKWIKANESELKIQPFHTFQLSFVRNGLAGETLRFQQMLNNVPVYQSEIVINFSPSNELVYSSNSYDSTIENIVTNPSISKEVALNKSKETLKVDGVYTVAENKLIVAKFNDQTKLAYRVVTNPLNGNASWEVMVDAQSGAILSTKDVAFYHNHEKNPKKDKENKKNKPAAKTVTAAPLAFVTGTAMVYLSDPLSFAAVAYGTAGYVDGSDANTTQLAAARTAVTLPEIDLTAGVYKLKSSYVEITDFEAPTTGLFTQATSAFNFTRDNNAFEAANVFYQLDKSMRYINQTLGIACIPNSNGGILRFDPSGLNQADNSHFLSGTDQISFGEGCVDDAEDSDVIWHELGHGLHDWMTNGGLSQVNGLSEGSGDYWAQSYSRSLNQWTPADAAYHYMFSWDGHNTCWGGRTTDYGATYPGGLVGQIHSDGQIWATVLMRIWDGIGREKTDKAFLEGLALTNSSTNQQNAAIAVRQAAINMNYPCADIMTMTQEFTATGYTMPTLPLSMAAIPNQTVSSSSYSLPSYAALANPISPVCTATLTQSPVVGTVLGPGVHTITMTATLGAATVTRTFTLTITALGIAEFDPNTVVVYPNPTSSQITIKGEFDANESITIHNLLGQKVMEAKINSNEQVINVSELATGIYTINFAASKATVKFIKE
ncbi:MAG: T9SS type A sorting domain-containing protein [Bacteroidota bacterium]